MDAGLIVAEVARRTGTLLDRNDPVLVVATVADIVVEGHQAEMRAGIAELRTVISSAQPRFDADAMRALGQVVRHDVLNLARNVRIGVLAGGVSAAIILCLALIGGGYWYGRSEARQEMVTVTNDLGTLVKVPGRSAEAALTLATQNNLGSLLAACKPELQDGRRFCQLLLWIEPVGQPPAPQK